MSLLKTAALVAATGPHFAARTGLPGSRHFLEDPEGKSTGTAATTTVITKDDLTRGLEELGKGIGAKLAEQREESIAKAKELEGKIVALGNGGSGGKVRQRFFGGLASGTPMTMRHDENVEERIERARESESVRYVTVPGHGRMPVIHSMPRGMQGIKNGSGLLAMRMLRASALCTAKDKVVTIDNALAEAHRAFGGDDDATHYLEEMRDVMAKHGNAAKEEREQIERVLGTAVLGSGAAFVAPQFWATFLDFLFPMSVVRKLGAASVPMNNGMIFNFFDTAVTASYVNEDEGVNESSPTDGSMQITRRILNAIVAISNDLLAQASYGVDAILRQHLAKALAAKSDLKFIQGRGTSSEPHGLDFWVEQPTTAHFFNRTLAAGVATYKTIRADLFTALQKITDENLPMGMGSGEGANPGVILQNRDAYGLMRVTVGTQEREPFYDEMVGGTLLGMPWAASTQTTKTAVGDGAGSGANNKSSVYVGDFGNLKIAEAEALQIETFRGGAYKNASGNVVSGITNRETVFAAAQEHELVELYRGKSFARVDSVDWGVAF